MIKQTLLTELQFFVNGVSAYNRGSQTTTANQQLVKCSLNLLNNLPSARDTIFEYFSLLFDVSVGNYVIQKERGERSDDKDLSGSTDDEAINDIQIALENLVNGPSAWIPLISSWSLRLLGKLSDKHARRRVLDIGSACSLWLGSSAIRCLLGLSALCFSKLDNNEAEACVSELLTIFVNHSPHFDWVVARLGSCFPLKVISKILQLGLKGFSGNTSTTVDSSDVGILGYLCFSHGNDLKFALREMMVVVLSDEEVNLQSNFNTIPYLLHLANMSEVLAQSVISVFLEMFSDKFLQKLKIQAAFWPPSYSPANLMPLLSKLILKSSENGTRLMLMLADIAENANNWSKELLELICTELEMLVFDDRSCALFADIIKDESRKILWDACVSHNTLVQQTSIRMILFVSNSKSPLLYHQTIAELIKAPNLTNLNALNGLVRILGNSYGISDVAEIKPAIKLILENVLISSSKRSHQNQNYYILHNLQQLVQLESTSQSIYLRKAHVTHALLDSLRKIILIWQNLLEKIQMEVEHTNLKKEDELDSIAKRIKVETHEELMEIDELEVEKMFVTKDQIHMVAKLLDLLEFQKEALNISDSLQLVKCTVKYFFWCLVEKDTSLRVQATNRCYSLLSKQSTNGKKSTRAAALRDLLEGACFLYGNLFGAPITQDESNAQIYHKKDDSLMKLNQKQGVSFSRSSVLHSGVIGYGPKSTLEWSEGPNCEIKNMFLNAIVACCQDQEHANTIDGFSYVSLLLLEMVSPDVIYNGLPWPEEEFSKVTMERDLQIRRTFRNAPILWSILALIAVHRPALCYCSVFLRAICATVLHQWRAKSTENVIGNNVELMFFTGKMLEILAIGQLLPSPLSYLYIVIQYLEPNEIAYVLKECVWAYMKDHVPTPNLFSVDANGLHWRDNENPLAQYVDPLKNTMQKRLSTMGKLYYHMFVYPEKVAKS